MFESCSMYSNLTIFPTYYYTIFSFFIFSPQTLFLPSSLSALVFIPIQQVPETFFGEPTYGHHGIVPSVSVLTGFYCSFFLKIYMVFTDTFFQNFVMVKSKLTPSHDIVKFSSRFTRLGLVLVDPQHFDNVMM